MKMLGVVTNFFKKLDQRFKVMLVAVGLYNYVRGLTSQYDQLYALSLGANSIDLGSLGAVSGLTNSLVSAPTGWLVDKYGVKRMIILGVSLSAVISIIYGFATDWRVLVPAIVLTPICMAMIFPFTDIIFVETTKLEERAFAMSLSRTVWAIPSVFAPMMAAVVVDRFGGINAQGIRPLYHVQIVSLILITLFIQFMLQPQEVHLPNRLKPFSLASHTGDFKELWKSEKWLKYWAIIMSLHAFEISLPASFVSIWMVNFKGADSYLLGIIGTVGTIASALMLIPMGRIADRIGRKKVFLLLRLFIYAGTALLIVAPSPYFLILVGILGGVGLTVGIGSVSFIPFITMFWESVPPDKKGRWFGFTGIFNIFAVPASIIGGLMWQAGLMELVLISPIIIEVLALIPILLRVPDTLTSTKA